MIANQIGVCGAKDWNVNDRRDVTGSSDDISCYNIRVPRQEFNVYRIDNGDTLYFGTHDKSNSSESRPTSIKTELKYTAE